MLTPKQWIGLAALCAVVLSTPADAYQVKTPAGHTIEVYGRIPYLPSYTACASFNPAVGATTVFEIKGSSTTTVQIHGLTVTATATTFGTMLASVAKRTTLSTGGTAALMTSISHSDQNPTRRAGVRVFTANPTALGTAIGDLVLTKLAFTDATQAANLAERPTFAGSTINDNIQPIVLTGANDNLTLDLIGTVPAGAAIRLCVTWNEGL